MAKETGQTPGNDIIAKLRGTAVVYADQSFDFRPDKESDKPLYNNILAECKFGSIKASDKSAVMRIVTDVKPTDLRAELMHKAMELISKVPDENADKLIVPDFTQFVGETLHSKVFLHKEGILIQSVYSFDEPNPKVADLVKQASPEQLKYIKQTLEPEAIYQAEVAAVCLLLADCKAQHERQEKMLNVKPRKSRKKDGSTK